MCEALPSVETFSGGVFEETAADVDGEEGFLGGLLFLLLGLCFGVQMSHDDENSHHIMKTVDKDTLQNGISQE